jgi:hypothetical protein
MARKELCYLCHQVVDLDADDFVVVREATD